MKIKILAFLGLALFNITGCVTNQATQPIPLSSGVRQAFIKYSAIPTSGYFAVSQDGKSAGWTYCPEFGGCSGLSNSGQAIYTCEQQSRGVPCVIYAYGGKLLVDDKTLTESQVQKNSADMTVTRNDRPIYSDNKPATSAQNTITQVTPMHNEQRPFAVTWDGVTDLAAGMAFLEENSRVGKMKVKLPGRLGECTGTFRFSDKVSGTWSVACGEGEAASGTFQGAGNGQGSVGVGQDTKGRVVRFTLSERN
ncbi:hypothetical protein ACIU1J_01370 [Azospirillum doebereinerae]|uniref:hypothetical protein n=1 Tax=Azospirillum doebereinerae TaxID=92933 RepID=UPI001EE58251|nr:hypothetical protein [Azospirillum doebereinerae]MCG5239985.1 hypothetical protein [Azospirillum doebereinerae]